MFWIRILIKILVFVSLPPSPYTHHHRVKLFFLFSSQVCITHVTFFLLLKDSNDIFVMLILQLWIVKWKFITMILVRWMTMMTLLARWKPRLLVIFMRKKEYMFKLFPFFTFTITTGAKYKGRWQRWWWKGFLSTWFWQKKTRRSKSDF